MKDARSCNKCGKAFESSSAIAIGHCRRCASVLADRKKVFKANRPKCPTCKYPLRLNQFVQEECTQCKYVNPEH